MSFEDPGQGESAKEGMVTERLRGVTEEGAEKAERDYEAAVDEVNRLYDMLEAAKEKARKLSEIRHEFARDQAKKKDYGITG